MLSAALIGLFAASYAGALTLAFVNLAQSPSFERRSYDLRLGNTLYQAKEAYIPILSMSHGFPMENARIQLEAQKRVMGF